MDDNLRKLTESWLLRGVETYRQPQWCPPVDVYQCRHGWLLKFELAGVRPEDIDVQTCGRELRVSGVRRDFCTHQGRAWSMEIAYNRFARAVELPCDLDGVEVRCEWRDGMLLVTLEPEG